MGMMTHDEIIKWLGYHKQGEIGKAAESIDLAIYTIEQYRKLQAEYNARLKADMVAMLTDLYLSMLELDMDDATYNSHFRQGFRTAKNMSTEVIQEKINALGGTDE